MNAQQLLPGMVDTPEQSLGNANDGTGRQGREFFFRKYFISSGAAPYSDFVKLTTGTFQRVIRPMVSLAFQWPNPSQPAAWMGNTGRVKIQPLQFTNAPIEPLPDDRPLAYKSYGIIPYEQYWIGPTDVDGSTS